MQAKRTRPKCHGGGGVQITYRLAEDCTCRNSACHPDKTYPPHVHRVLKFAALISNISGQPQQQQSLAAAAAAAAAVVPVLRHKFGTGPDYLVSRRTSPHAHVRPESDLPQTQATVQEASSLLVSGQRVATLHDLDEDSAHGDHSRDQLAAVFKSKWSFTQTSGAGLHVVPDPKAGPSHTHRPTGKMEY